MRLTMAQQEMWRLANELRDADGMMTVRAVVTEMAMGRDTALRLLAELSTAPG